MKRNIVKPQLKSRYTVDLSKTSQIFGGQKLGGQARSLRSNTAVVKSSKVESRHVAPRITAQARPGLGRQNLVGQTIASKINSMSLINILLIASILTFTFIYVVTANRFTADKFRLSMLSSELSSLQDINSILMAQKSAVIDRDTLVLFARGNNMVEVGNISYIFEKGNVAIGR